MICGACQREVSVLANVCPYCHADLRQIGAFRRYVETPEVISEGVCPAPPGQDAQPKLQGEVPAGFDLAKDLKELVAQVAGSVVTVRAREEDETEGSESGFAVAGTCFVVTNRHVIENAEEVTIVTRDNRAIAARVSRAGKRVDIAVLEPRSPVGKGVPLGDSDTVGPGEFIFVIGNPLGELPNSVTIGVISGIRQFENTGNLLQLDAAISPGNSGGPVFNVKGEVIGVVAASVVVQRAQNLNLAIPSNEVRSLLRAVK